jgi:hypothetical protein
VRLYIPSISIGNQQILTLVLTPTIGGGLVDGLVVFQQGQTLPAAQSPVTAYKNYSARVRVVADYVSTIGAITSATATTAATTAGVSLASSLSSPSVGSYAVVPLSAATTTQLNVALSVNSGGPVTGYTGPVTPGQDYTLLAYGNGATTPQLIVDDNTLATSGYAKLRLVNGVNNLTGNISLTYGGVPVQNAQNEALRASPVATNLLIPGGSPEPLSVIFGGGSNYAGAVPSLGSPTLSAQGVYSLFILGDIPAASGVVSSDHSFQGP